MPIEPVPIPAIHEPVPTSQNPADFDHNADQTMASLPPAVAGVNAAAQVTYLNAQEVKVNADQVSANTAIALAAANFKGLWAAQAGAAAPPFSVKHSGRYWLLLSPIANIATKEPGVAPEWEQIETEPGRRVVFAGDRNLSLQDVRDTLAFTGAVQSTLTLLAAITFGQAEFTVVNEGTANVAVARAGADLISGQASRLVRPGEVVKFQSNGVDSWFATTLAVPIGTRITSEGAPAAGWLRRDGSAILRSAYPALFALVGHKYTQFDSLSYNATTIVFTGGAPLYGRMERIKGRAIGHGPISASVYNLTNFGPSFSPGMASPGQQSIPSITSMGSNPAIFTPSPTTNCFAGSIGNRALLFTDATNVALPRVFQSGLSKIGRRCAVGQGKFWFRNDADIVSIDDNGAASSFGTAAGVVGSSETGSLASTAIGLIYSEALGQFITANYDTTVGRRTATPLNGASWANVAFPEKVADIAMLPDGETIVMLALNTGAVYTSTDAVNWTMLGYSGITSGGRIWPQSNGIFAIAIEGSLPSQDNKLILGNKHGLAGEDYDYTSSYSSTATQRPLGVTADANNYAPYWNAPFWDETTSSWWGLTYNSSSTQHRIVAATASAFNVTTHFTLGKVRQSTSSYQPHSPFQHVRGL